MPEGWCLASLMDAANDISAGGDKPIEFSKTKTNIYTIPIYANGIENEGLYGYTNKAKIEEEALTISARGTIGFTCIRTAPFVPIVRLITIIPNNAISVKYLKFYLDAALRLSEGSSIPQLTVPTIKKQLLLVPPFAEQERIVKAIEVAYDQFNKMMESL